MTAQSGGYVTDIPLLAHTRRAMQKGMDFPVHPFLLKFIMSINCRKTQPGVC